MCSKISAFLRQQPIMFRSPPLTPPVTNRFTLIRSTVATPRIRARSPLTRSTSPQPNNSQSNGIAQSQAAVVGQQYRRFPLSRGDVSAVRFRPQPDPVSAPRNAPFSPRKPRESENRESESSPAKSAVCRDCVCYPLYCDPNEFFDRSLESSLRRDAENPSRTGISTRDARARQTI